MQIIKKTGKDLRANDIFIITDSDEVGWIIDEIVPVNNRFQLHTRRGQTNKSFFVHPDQPVNVVIKRR